MFLLGVDWPAAIDGFALSAAACVGASYVGYLAIDAFGRLAQRRRVEEPASITVHNELP